MYPDGDPDRHRNLIICSFGPCPPSLKISCTTVRKFLRKVANRQTNNDENISFLTEVNIPSHLKCVATLPCEILMSEKRTTWTIGLLWLTIHHSSVATWFRCNRYHYCWICFERMFKIGQRMAKICGKSRVAPVFRIQHTLYKKKVHIQEKRTRRCSAEETTRCGLITQCTEIFSILSLLFYYDWCSLLKNFIY